MIQRNRWLGCLILPLLAASLASELSLKLTVNHDDDSGTANCSISGISRPIRLEVTVDDDAYSAVEITNRSERSTKASLNETNYYSVMAEYQITGCINAFKMYCVPALDQNNVSIDSVFEEVQTDGIYCETKGGNPALVVVLILVIITLFAAVGAAYLYKKRTGQNLFTDMVSKARASRRKEDKDNHDEEKAETEPLTTESKKETPKDLFIKTLCVFCEKLENGKVKKGEFNTLLTEFYLEREVDPFPFLEDFLKNEDLDNQVTMKLAMQFVACKRNEWILSSKVAKLLSVAVEKQQLPFEDRLQMFGNMYSNKQINRDEYILLTLSLFTDKMDEFEKAIESVISSTKKVDRNLLETLVECLEEYLNNDYEILKPTSGEDGVEVIISSEPESDIEDNDRIVMMRSLSGSKNANDVFLRLLLLGVERAKITADFCITIVKDCTDLLHREYVFIITSGETWISMNIFIDLLKASRRSGVDTDAFFILQLSTLLFNEKLSTGEYIEELKSSLKEELISKECLVTQLEGCIKSEKLTKVSLLEVCRRSLDEDWWNKEEWIKMLFPITTGRQDNMEATNLLIEIIKKYQITKDDMKTILDNAGIPDDAQQKLFQNDKVFKKLEKSRKSKKGKK